MRYALALSAAVLAVHGLCDQALAQTAAPVDTAGRAGMARVEAPGSGTYLARVLASVARGQPVRIDVPVEVTVPESHSALVYASRYGIAPDLAQRIIDVAAAEGVDPELGFRLIRVESVFRTRARGPAGALGLTQLMPGTARSIDRSVRTEADIMEPSTNLRLGFRYLRSMIEMYDGDVRLGLLAYNRGPGAVNRALRSGRDPENGYSHKVLGTRGGRPYRGAGLVSRGN